MSDIDKIMLANATNEKIEELEAQLSGANDVIYDLNHQLECIPELRAQVEALTKEKNHFREVIHDIERVIVRAFYNPNNQGEDL